MRSEIFLIFFQQVLTDLRTIHKEKGAEVFYATSEIPIFFYCFYPEIIQFKLYLWARTIWDMEYVKNNPFDFDLIAFPIMQATEELVKTLSPHSFHRIMEPEYC